MVKNLPSVERYPGGGQERGGAIFLRCGFGGDFGPGVWGKQLHAGSPEKPVFLRNPAPGITEKLSPKNWHGKNTEKGLFLRVSGSAVWL